MGNDFLIEVLPCEDKLEKEARLRYWKEELKPTLNRTDSNKMCFDDYRKLWEKENRKIKRMKRTKKKKKQEEEEEEEEEEIENKTKDWMEEQISFELKFN